jgi:4-amino-4-deoxy-L-arabinose transferase-like glycosyltransferase
MTKRARRPPLATKAVAPAPNVVPRWCFVALGIVIIFFSLIRVRLLNLPLERDEGEYAYAGQLMLQGIPPYHLAYNMKLPGTYAAYSLIMGVFGQTPTGIHVGLLVVNAATVFLIFLLAVRLFGPVAGLAAGSSYALLSTSESVLGFAGHATHFVVLAALGGILVLLKAIENQRMVFYFASGLLLGLSFVCKQPGIFFVLFGGFFVIMSEWRRGTDWRALARRVAVFSAGTAIPFA